MIEIYSKDNCGYCTAAKQLLDRLGIPYHELKLDEDFTREQMMQRAPNARTFPQVFVDGRNIGGYNELVRLSSNWTLNVNESTDPRSFLAE